MQAAAAEIFLLAAICVILLVDVFLSDRMRWVTYALSLLTLAGAAFVTVELRRRRARERVQRHVRRRSDGRRAEAVLVRHGRASRSSIRASICSAAACSKASTSFSALVALLGIMVMISAGNLVTVYLGVELLSLSLYAMVAFDRDSGVAGRVAR